MGYLQFEQFQKIRLVRVGGNRWAQWPLRLYISFMRGTPLLAQLFLDEEQLAPETLSYQDAWAVHAAAEQCKLALSKSAEAEMTVTLNGAVHARTFSLARFEAACAPLLEKIRGPIERSLRDASVHMADIDEIVLVGGATKSPVVRRFVAKLFGRIPNTSVDPDEAIAIGAAVQCGMKERSAAVREIILTDVCHGRCLGDRLQGTCNGIRARGYIYSLAADTGWAPNPAYLLNNGIGRHT